MRSHSHLALPVGRLAHRVGRLALACALLGVVLAVVLAGAAGSARAQATPAVEPEMATAKVMRSSGACAPRPQNRCSMPPGSLVIGADVTFVTGAGGLGPNELLFSDVVLFRPRLRYSLNPRAELFIGTTFLPQAAELHRRADLQGGTRRLAHRHLGAHIPVTERRGRSAHARWGRRPRLVGGRRGQSAGAQDARGDHRLSGRHRRLRRLALSRRHRHPVLARGN